MFKRLKLALFFRINFLFTLLRIFMTKVIKKYYCLFSFEILGLVLIWSGKVHRFDGGELLKRWRGKKVMFVGDSLSLNMWNSLACMIHASVPTAKITYSRQETLSYVTFKVSPILSFLFITFPL